MSLAPAAGPPRSSGKTPPPAPSAAFAKRAREIQEESLGSRYRPPALRTFNASGGRLSVSGEPPSVDDLAPPPAATGDLAPSSVPSGYRRARAGTLPSNVHLGAQHTSGLPTTDSQSSETSTSKIPEESVEASPVAPIRPSLRHAASSAASVLTSSRLRSGSLNVPSAGLSNAFGPSIFSSSWLSNANGFPTVDELKSIASGDSQVDDNDVHTLDYLGLDDAPFRTPPPTQVSDIRASAQAAMASSLAIPSRMRASTVSNPYRRRQISNLMSSSSVDIEEAAEPDENAGSEEAQMQDRMDANDATLNSAGALGMNASYIAKGFKPSVHLGVPTSVRPRAISVGNLDDPNRLTLGRRATVTALPPGLVRKSSYNDLSSYTSSVNSVQAALLRQMMPNANGARPMQSVRQAGGVAISAGLAAPPGLGITRSVSPGRENTQGQVPSRSLWIGNLDPAVTGEDLAHVFAPYGAIESFRLLPEKECGFINFIDTADAIRAKDDVLNRLGGNIGMPNGQLVRIGFGKVDSAPLTPLAGGAVNNAPPSPLVGSGLRTAQGSGANTPNTPTLGADSQTQSSPTRALWIGSIPATTTPATILSVFSPFGPIESARVLTHKNCGFVNFERLDDAIRARKALNGRDVLGSDVGAVRIGYARVPVKNATGPDGQPIASDDATNVSIPGGKDITFGKVLHGLRSVKGASMMPVDQQVLGGGVENYRSNLLLSMISSGAHAKATSAATDGKLGIVTEQQLIMQELSNSAPDAATEIAALSEFRPPTMYYTSIPLVSERASNRQWDAARLREFRKRIDSGTCHLDEIDHIASTLMDGEIVELASDWLGNTVVQKLFEKCSVGPRITMLERLAPHLAMIGIHKNGTWAAQKIIDCATTQEEHIILTQHLRPFCPPLMLDQFGNYVVQCCLKFGSPMNDFIVDAMTDRLWEIAQGRFGARSMRAVLENPLLSLNQQRRVATAVILNSIPLATNPNGALLLTWLLEASGFHSRFSLLAPRFAPHLSHLCTHKLASNTVIRIVNQKTEPEASAHIVNALFFSPNDQVLTDVLGDQVNGVAVVHKILQSQFVEISLKQSLLEVTKRVLVELKVTGSQAYRRLIEEVGLPVPNFSANYGSSAPKKTMLGTSPSSYPGDQSSLAAMMAALQMQPPVGLPMNPSLSSSTLQTNHAFQQGLSALGGSGIQTPQSSVGSNPDSLHNLLRGGPKIGGLATMTSASQGIPGPSASHATNRTGMGMIGQSQPSPVQAQGYQQYTYQLFQQQQPNVGAFHA